MQPARIIQSLKEKAFSVVLLIVALYLYNMALHFEFVLKPGRIGPDFWPKVILGLLILLAALDIICGLVAGCKLDAKSSLLAGVVPPPKEEEEETGSAVTEKEEEPVKYPKLLALGMALTVAYVALSDTLGFVVTSFAYLVIFMYLGRYRKHAVIWLGSAVGTVLLLLIFVKVVYVSLPIGVPPFDQLTFFLYRILGIE